MSFPRKRETSYMLRLVSRPAYRQAGCAGMTNCCYIRKFAHRPEVLLGIQTLSRCKIGTGCRDNSYIYENSYLANSKFARTIPRN